jgi:tetratricopeptide (TPR) repeat protein
MSSNRYQHVRVLNWVARRSSATTLATAVPMPFSSWRAWLCSHKLATAVILVVVALILYAPALGGSFVYFDRFEIQGNPAVTTPGLWLQNFTYSAGTARAGRGFYYRPLEFLSYGLVYHFAGPRPFAFHLLQLMLYAATLWVVFRLGCELLNNEVTAFVGALLWAVHPAHVEALAWITSFCDVGCAFFYLWAFRLFLVAEKAKRHRSILDFEAALAFFAALFFKELAFSFPLMILSYWFFLARERETWIKRAFRGAPYVLAFGLYLLVRIRVMGHMTSAGANAWSSSQSLVLRSLTLFGEHTKIFFWPTQLSFGRTTGLHDGSLFPWPVLALSGLGLAFAFRNREPLIAFLVFWWPVALAPCLDIRQLTFPFVADRFSYLPSVGLCLATSHLLFHWLPQRFPTLRSSYFAISAAAAVTFLWAFETLHTIPHWGSDDAFSAYSIRASPKVPIFHAVRGRVLATERGDIDGAAKEFATAIRLSASDPGVWYAAAHDAHMGLANIARLRGQFDDAALEYERAAANMASNSYAYKELASLYLQQGNLTKVAEYLTQVVRLEPQVLEERYNLGVCWFKLGKYREAAEQFSAVMVANPDFPNVQEAEAQARVRALQQK